MSVSTELELRAAISNATAGVSVVIALEGNIQLTGTPLVISANKHITLTSNGDDEFKLIGASSTDTITVSDGGVLELAGIIITHVSGTLGRGVNVSSGGTLTMSNGKISGNTSANGGGVYNNAGSFTMSGGTISNNTANTFGGGVCNFGGSFTMSGGTISNNTANAGGGVYNNAGSFTMLTGTISSNTANNGGGIYNNGSFTMLNGTISNNTATSEGGGIYLSNGSVELSGGTLSGNTASYDGGGIWVALENLDKLYINSNVVFSNNRAISACNRAAAQDPVYNTNIASNVTWTAPFTQGYNNYDISNPNGAPLKYNVTVNDSSAAELSGAGSYIQNAKVTINAGTRPGYTFTGWTTNESGFILPNISTVSFDMPAKDVAVTVNWKINDKYNVTVHDGDGQFSGTGSYIEGLSATIVAGSRPGYTFVGWTVNEGGIVLPNTPTASFTMPAKNVIVTANWQANEYNVTVNNTYITPPLASGAGNHIQGQTVTINAGTRIGYTFIGWTITEGGITLPNTSTTSFTMPIQNVIVTANWQADNKYTVMVNDSYTESPGTGSYLQGQTVTINAGTRLGYTFIGWTTNENNLITLPNTSIATFAMPAKDVTITANWQANEYNVTVNNTDVTPPLASGAGNYLYGQPVTIVAGSRPGYTFVGWTVNEGGIVLPNTPTASFTMPIQNVTIIANWRNDNEHTVMVNDSYAESPGAGNYLYGQPVTIVAGSRPGYTFVGWTVNEGGIVLPNTPTVTFIMPTTNVAVTASWQVNEYNLTVNKSYATSTSGTGKYLPGQTVTINAGNMIGLIFTGWTTNESDLTLPNTPTVSFDMPAKDVIVTANWHMSISSVATNVSDAAKAVSTAFSAFQKFAGNVQTNVNTNVAYDVKVNESYAGLSGTGNYLQNVKVNINAGSRSGYTFIGWTVNEGGIILSNASTASFTMPAKKVTVTANWKKTVTSPAISALNARSMVPPRT